MNPSNQQRINISRAKTVVFGNPTIVQHMELDRVLVNVE